VRGVQTSGRLGDARPTPLLPSAQVATISLSSTLRREQSSCSHATPQGTRARLPSVPPLSPPSPPSTLGETLEALEGRAGAGLSQGLAAGCVCCDDAAACMCCDDADACVCCDDAAACMCWEDEGCRTSCGASRDAEACTFCGVWRDAGCSACHDACRRLNSCRCCRASFLLPFNCFCLSAQD